MDKLAEGLQRLQEDDLLNMVQLLHEKKTPEMYTKNDVESKHAAQPSFRQLHSVLSCIL